MLKHYNFIPFKLSTLPEGSILVFAPHPDDETFGLGGSILQLSEHGETINVVMMTDGGEGGEAAVRKTELEKACTLLGVNDLVFFGVKDGEIAINTANIKKIITLIEQYRPVSIFFPSPLEYHPDHRATAWLVWDALQSIDYKGNVFSYEIANQSPVNTLVDISSVIGKKEQIMKLYASQQAQHSYVETIVSMNRMRAYTLVDEKVSYAEGFFKFPDITMDLMSYYYKIFNTYHKGVKTEKLPLVSVLVRTKDRADRLKHALESIVKQTYQQIEVNIVNDGGVSVQSVVDAFDFERVFVKTHESSKGRAAAANALLRMVQGEYAIFLDDDDTFDADHIENLVKVIRQNENMLAVYSGVRVGEGIDNPPFNQSYNAALLRRMNFIPFHAVLFSTKLIEDGCTFDESLEVYEDWDFWLHVAQRTEFHHLKKITATYNINGQSGAGGAGGQTLNEKDLHYWTLKVYEKWQCVWSANQISQTFNALATLNASQLQDVKKKMQVLTEENNKKLAKRDESIKEIQNRFENQQKINKPLNNHIDLLLEECIKGNDDGDPSKRDFELHSTRNYQAQCMTLFEEVFKENMTKAFWDWKYQPRGMKWRGICAVKDGKVIGHYNGMARDILYFGKYKSALASGDTMVSPKARGGIKQNSPFYNLVRVWANINLGLKKEFLLSFGFPNKRVMSLSEKIGLYKEVDTITEIHWETAEKENDSSCIVEKYDLTNDKTNEEIRELWIKMASDFKDALLCVRPPHYLKYRYVNHPKFKYDIYLVRDKSSTLLSLFILKKEGDKMLFMDMVTSKQNFGMTISEALKISAKNECPSMKCWITTSKVDLFKHHHANAKQIDVSIPTSNFTPGFDPNSIKDKWFLMYGDTDFI